MKNYNHKEGRAKFGILLIVGFVIWLSIPIATHYRNMTVAQHQRLRSKQVSKGHIEADSLYTVDPRTSRYVLK